MRRILIFAVGALAALLAACGGDEPQATPATEPPPPRIVATTPLLGDVARALVGTTAEVDVIVSDDVEPWEHEATDEDRAALEGADVVLAVGLDYEGALAPALDEAAAAGVPVVEVAERVAAEPCATPDVEVSPPSTEATAVSAGTGGTTEPGPTTTTTAEGSDEVGPCTSSGRDPRVWVDADRATAVVEVIVDELAATTSLDEVLLRQRAEAYIGEIRLADEELQEALLEVPSDARYLVTTRSELAYLASRHDLRLVLVDDDPATMPDDLLAAVVATGAPAAFVSAADAEVVGAPTDPDGEALEIVVVRADRLGERASPPGSYLELIDRLGEQVADAFADAGTDTDASTDP